MFVTAVLLLTFAPPRAHCGLKMFPEKKDSWVVLPLPAMPLIQGAKKLLDDSASALL